MIMSSFSKVEMSYFNDGKISLFGSSPKELVDEKDSRGQGVKDSSEMLKDYKELKVWQKSYQLCLEIYIFALYM